MPIEPKEIFSYLGIPETETLDDFKQKFDTSFVKADPQAIKGNKELWGTVTGVYNETNKGIFKRIAKENGIELVGNDLDGLNIGEVISTMLPKALKNLTTEIGTLKEAAGKGVNEKVAAVQSEYEKFKAEVTPKVQEYEKLKSDFETFKTTAAKEKSDFILNHKKEEQWQKFPYAQAAGNMAKAGFKNHVESKYGWVTDESGEVFPTDKAGNKIPNPNKAGSHYNMGEILVIEGTEANKTDKIFAVNDSAGGQGAGQKRIPTTFVVKDKNEDSGQLQGRKINTGTRNKVAA